MPNLIPRPFPVKSEHGYVIGEVRAGVFRKDKLLGSKHMMRKPRGWALDVASLAQAESHGADLVQLTDQETGVVYRAPITRFNENGVQINRGYGRQICLPLEFWEVESQIPRLPPEATGNSDAVQLTLFEASKKHRPRVQAVVDNSRPVLIQASASEAER